MSSNPAPVTLKPDVRLPLLVVALGLALLPLPLSPWPTLVVASVSYTHLTLPTKA